MVSEESVVEALKRVMDPELNVNIYDLGLIYEISVIDEGDVFILMTLTTPGCPLHGVFDELVKREVRKVDGIGNIDVELTFEPRWTPEEMTDEARNKVGHIPGQDPF